MYQPQTRHFLNHLLAMKTLQLLLEITVPDQVTPEMIEVESFMQDFLIGATDENVHRIDLFEGRAWLRECTEKDKPSVIFIIWGIDDFRSRAFEKEVDNDEEWAANHQDYDINLLDPADQPKLLYDRSKFSLALERMEHHHDCNNGITWDTIDYYLDEYCLL